MNRAIRKCMVARVSSMAGWFLRETGIGTGYISFRTEEDKRTTDFRGFNRE